MSVQCEYEVNGHDMDGSWMAMDCLGEADTLVEVEDLTFGDGPAVLPFCASHAVKVVAEAEKDPTLKAKVVS